MTLDDIAEIRVEYDRARGIYLKANIYEKDFNVKLELYRHWQRHYSSACIAYVEEQLT